MIATALPMEGQWRLASPLWHLVPGMFRWFDFPDLLAATAPRPLLLTEGGVTPQIARVARAYERLGAAERFEVHYYPKYATPADRAHDHDEMPEGLTQDEYFKYANVDAPQHSFKGHLAVHWLRRALAE
jgi:hypothetical protein